MKKLIIILLVIVSCSGIEIEDIIDVDVINSPYSTLLTITGTYRVTEANNNGLNFGNVRSKEEGESVDVTVTFADITVQNIILVKTINRAVVQFNISALPEYAQIDSVTLELYCSFIDLDGGSNLGLVIYDARSSLCEVDYLKDFGAAVGVNGGIPQFDMLDFIETSTVGWHTFQVNVLPILSTTADEIASYGLGCFKYDYTAFPPPLGRLPHQYWRVDDPSFEAKLNIYYTPTSPTTAGGRIYSIF